MDYLGSAQIDSIVDRHNQAFRENTQAINEMRSTLGSAN